MQNKNVSDFTILPASLKKRKWRSNLSSEVKDKILEKRRKRYALVQKERRERALVQSESERESERELFDRRLKARLKKQQYRSNMSEEKKSIARTKGTTLRKKRRNDKIHNSQTAIKCFAEPSFYLADNGIYFMPYDIPSSIEVKYVLGEGTFGKVFRMSNIEKYSKPREKAIKLFKMESSRGRNDKKMCMHESAVFKKLGALENNLKYVVQFYGAYFNPDLSRYPNFKFRYMIITDYCEYDLESYLETNFITLGQKFSLVFKLSEAINWLHKTGRYMHRDIKPKNILIVTKNDGTISPRINDFGAACDVDYKFKPTEWKMKVSTVDYESIEQTWNDNYTFRVDYWAMGIVFEKIFTLSNLRARETNFRSCWLEKYNASMTPSLIRREDWIPYSHVESDEDYFNDGLQSYLLCLESEERSIDKFVSHLQEWVKTFKILVE
jgi:hypothetical protein